MDTYGNILKKAITLSGMAGSSGLVPESIRKSFSVDLTKESTYLDTEHVVMLMQENRSFDHCFGILRSARGFNDRSEKSEESKA